MSARTHAFITLALLACPACTFAEDEDAEFRATTVTTGGTGSGTVFNTHHIEDVDFSELRLPMGVPHFDIALDAVVLADETDVVDLKFADGEIVAIDEDGAAHGGDALIGSLWHLDSFGLMTDSIEMRIGGIDWVDGVPYYDFQHQVGETWVHNCDVTASKNITFARVLSGFTLDENNGEISPAAGHAFLACNDAAVGKAASWGYYGQSLMAGHFHALETAIRVVRADYCYDGHSHTAAGTPLQVEDIWGYRQATDADLPVEAVWGADGLLCAGTARGNVDMTKVCPELDVDPCKDSAQLGDYPGGLFLTRVPLVEEPELGVLPNPGFDI